MKRHVPLRRTAWQRAADTVTYRCLICGTETLYPHACPAFNPPHLASKPVSDWPEPTP